MSTAVAPQTRTPNQFHLHGRDIGVSYFPDGFGPPVKDEGPTILTYQDAHRSLVFHESEVRTVDVPDLGRLVSVTLVRTVDVGSTTFSLIVPDVQLPADASSTTIHTEGITTIHRIFAAAIGHPQHETYTVTKLTGTAAVGPLPL